MTNEAKLISSNTKEKAVLLDKGGFCPNSEYDDRRPINMGCVDCIAAWLQKEEEKK